MKLIYVLFIVAEQPEVLYFENFDLENIKTPVKVEVFKSLLEESAYDVIETEFSVEGFSNGFSIRYNGPEGVTINSPNLKFREVGDPVTLWNKVMKDVKEKRYAGPFEKIPFKHYIQSPMGLVPKDGGKDTRLIEVLSMPIHLKICVQSNTQISVMQCNFASEKDEIAKSDMNSAFRNMGIMLKHWKYLVMKAVSPLDGKTYYFVDKCLPFGASISCSNFKEVCNN